MKSLTLALCVIAILGSAASTFFYFQIGNSKEELQQQVITTENRASDLQTKLSESAAQTEAIQKRLAALDSDLGEAKSKTTSAETRNSQLSRDVAQLRNQITAKEDAEQSLNREIGDLKRELAQSKLSSSGVSSEEVDGYKATIATLQARVNELQAGRGNTLAELPNTTVPGSVAPVQPSSSLSGEVVSIGNKNAFVVINVGSDQGVQINQQFAISRDGSDVAKASVSSVEKNYAIAFVAADSLKGGLLKGDKAALVQ
jgi:predicted RNase H-like nuclease (RuvC/YqgF family)